MDQNEPNEPAKPLRLPVAKQPPPAVSKRPPSTGEDEPTETVLASPRATRTLLVLVAVLVVLVILQGLWFFLHGRENDDRAEAAESSVSEESGEDDPISVPEGRPVVLNQLAVQEGVEAAALAAQTMFARNWESYDQGVDDAVALMTEEFAEEYRGTTDDVRREFLAEKTQVQVRVVAQSVVRANDAELEALLFLNQYTITGADEDPKTTYTPYRAVLTMVHTDDGWLVDAVDTK
ncbi:hypothetical protein [Nocardioides bizhenqiangii]|uniref:Mce-associated membrane protein n=1 Tax=Nocardioides bizhenqiangii TaxID=3095076 RepID=A0ABZ0ZKC9_9ACTN|nr:MULTISPECIES: hypothetical protein [unclassified Nocardioides]MDZ5620483.1 hypothetical protein [Nocardioides sp. HM23]WQQ24851.1 hypothetical protein SHK19_12825 [Nocardioides sp. HM61]